MSLKSNYPGIIVDVISAINRDSRVNPFIIEKYYQLKKQEAASAKEEKTLTMTTTTTAAAIHKEKLPLYEDEVVERIVHITNRDRKEVEESLAKLEYSDLNKISDLSSNYSKLQHYSKLITAKEQLKMKLKEK